jgi:superfamily I DNA and/or RNA helicase
MKVDYRDRNCLVILSAQDWSSAMLEQKREQAWEPPYEFKFGQPARRSEAREVIEALQLAVEEHEADRRQAQAAAEKQRLFRVWGDILRAKKDWEEEQETPLKYQSVEVNGNRAVFELSSLPENDIAGQSRCVKHTKGFLLVAGEVEEIKGNKLILYIRRGDPDRLPPSGELRFDIQAAEVAINRQKAALDAVRFDRSVRADMRQLLVNPQKVRPPEFEETIQFIQPLNLSQQEVVKAALGNQDFLIVQGPPGTGKTTFITEAILQTLQQNPQARILLSSQTHVALDNALERIQAKKPDLKLLRIGNHERVADNIHSLLLEAQMNRWREEVLDRADKFLADWSAQKGISPRDLKIATFFQELRNLAIKIEYLRNEVATHQQQIDEIIGTSYDPNNPESIETLNVPEDRLEDVQRLTEEIDQLRQQLKSARKEQKKIAQELKEFTEIGVNKLSRLSASELELRVNELIDPNSPDAKLLKKLLAIQTEWFEQFGRNNTFNVPLIKRSQLVAGTCIGIANNIQDIEFDLCIVDEASKATATEVLVPMSRAKRWILVGDPKQLPPFQDEASRNSEFLSNYELNPEDIKETLFDRLLATLPEENCKMLTIQHRMIAPIGDLVSHCFYEGQIESARTDIDRDLEAVFPKPVTWFTTTKLR